MPIRAQLYYPVVMEPPGGVSSDKDRQLVVHQQPNLSLLKSTKHQQPLSQAQAQAHAQPPAQQQHNSALLGISVGSQQTIEKLSRPLAFDKMESLVREMQDPEHGVPVRQQKMFLTSIPYAFMGYDLIEWLMDRLMIEESEALNIANQLCLHGYFFPVNDTKTLVVKDDSSLYRFQTPYYWPWQHKAPDNVEYAIYLAKRSLRNKQRHALEDYESEALASLHKNLKGKWDFISMQADEQVRLAKERKKGDKIVGDSQERAYWRVHRPPPGQFTPLEPCPVPSRDRQGLKSKKKTVEDLQREVEYLQKSLNRTRMKMSQACESLVNYSETFADYDFFLQPVLPSNPWVTEDVTFWQLNNTIVDIPTEKRVRRWAISIEELVSDPTGLHEFTVFLEKEYSHENIRFWIAVNRLRRSAHSQVSKKVTEIYEEFLKPGAPCEINIDGKTMEVVQKGLKNPSRFTFDAAAEHIYMLLLKKDCYPRFIRSEHYKNLLATGIQPLHKKRFFNFGGVGVKKKVAVNAANLATQSHGSGTSAASAAAGAGAGGACSAPVPLPGHLARRRGSDRSLSGSVHELAVIGIKDAGSKVPHSHSQSNLCDISYRDAAKGAVDKLETTIEAASAICPWDEVESSQDNSATIQLSVCPWEQEEPQTTSKRLASTSSDISDVSDRMRRSCGLRQNTVDSCESSTKRLMPNFTEQRRASVTLTPRISEYARSMKATSLNVPIFTEDITFRSSSEDLKKSTTNISKNNESVVSIKPIEPDVILPPQQQPPPPLPPVEIISSTVTIVDDDDVDDDEDFDGVDHHDDEQKITPDDNPDDESTNNQVNTSDHVGDNDDDNGDSKESAVQTEVQIELIQMETNISDTQNLASTSVEIPESLDDDKTSDKTFDDQTTIIIDPDNKKNNHQPLTVVGETSAKDIVDIPASSSKMALDEYKSATNNCKIAKSNSSNWPANDTNTSHLQRSNTTNTKSSLKKAPSIQVECLVDVKYQENPSISEKVNIITCLDPIEADIPIELPSNATPNTPTTQSSSVAVLGVNKTISSPAIATKEEEEMGDEDENLLHEELSPTTDEYHEGLQFEGRTESYDYDIDDVITPGCVAPAPTPAPSLAPLAEIDIDPVDDEIEQPPKKPEPEELKKKRKKHSSETRKSLDKTNTNPSASGAAKKDGDRKTVCPWEDPENTTSDGTFVKTYATLGYL